MTTQDIVDFLHKEGIKATAENNGMLHSVVIETEEEIPIQIKQRLDFFRPVGSVFHYRIKVKEKNPIPDTLKKWVKETGKYLK